MNDVQSVNVVGEVIKHGESCIRIVLHRTALGLSLQVKVHPIVEDFIRDLGNGEKMDIGIVGRHWVNLKDASKPLMAYVIPGMAIPSLGGIRVTLGEGLGQPLVMLDDGKPILKGQERADAINISFLRLVGASEGIGVTFGVKGVYGKETLEKLRDNLVRAARLFYIEYLQPMDLGLNIERGSGAVTTQDVRF